MTAPVDARGNQIRVGDLVVYATNARESGLNFGTVRQIVQKKDTISYNGDFIRHNFIITVDKTDAEGNPEMVRNYDYERHEYVDTHVQAKSGQVQYAKYKFLILK